MTERVGDSASGAPDDERRRLLVFLRKLPHDFANAILPFRINKLTLAANPLKLREYLAAGLPVVATALPEAERLAPWVRVGHNHEHFLHQLDAVVESGELGPSARRSAAMEKESWDAKVEAMSDIVGGYLERPAARRALA